MSRTESRRGVHSEQSRIADDECEECSYCGLPFIRMHHEHDHAPVPKSMGGTNLMPACITCHDLKDRVSFPHWPASEAVSALIELANHGLLTDLTSVDQLPEQWSSLSRWARIAWAKIVRLALTDPDGATVRKIALAVAR